MSDAKKPIVICCDHKTVNNYLMLDMDKFIVHDDPIVNVVNGKVLANFDYYLDVNSWGTNYAPLLKEKYIKCIRWPKRRQMIEARRAGISTPPFTLSTSNDINMICNNVAKLFDDVAEPDDEVLIKVDDGARGVGQVVVKFKDLYRFVDKHINAKDPISKDADWYKLGGDVDAPDLEEETIQMFKDYTVTYYKKIELQREFRMLFNCAGHYQLSERNISSQAGYQCNGGEFNELFSKVSDSEIDKILQFVISTGLPFGSVDIYIDSDGNYGIFEYCPQFGYRGHDINSVKDLIEDGVTYAIKMASEK